MNTLDKNKFPEVFIENEDMEEIDVLYFKNINLNDKSREEVLFFQNLKEKIEGEFVVGMDQLIHENDNKDNIYVIRYYYSEFLIGKVFEGNARKKLYFVSFTDTMNANLFSLLNENITFLEWLRRNHFQGINYYNNSYIKRYGGY